MRDDEFLSETRYIASFFFLALFCYSSNKPHSKISPLCRTLRHVVQLVIALTQYNARASDRSTIDPRFTRTRIAFLLKKLEEPIQREVAR